MNALKVFIQLASSARLQHQQVQIAHRGLQEIAGRRTHPHPWWREAAALNTLESK